ncbi:hypothetical protein [Phenylobacterium sp.]|uniref:hypothetical protein n=1 Tax=Phenylobacterium sp. TaxID=1871053 RepID=UPI0025FC4968|nr:hypothetical protein [Phenylobacterium sp.]
MRLGARLAIVAVTALFSIGRPALAAPPQTPPAADLATLQQQLNALRSEYDAKIGNLETRLKAAEDRAAAATAAAPVATAAADAPPPAEGEVVIAEAAPEPMVHTSSANAMNPGISVVLNGNYVATSHDPAGARIAGFPLSADAGPFSRGFSLGESEVTLAASVDPYFAANLTATFGRDDTVSVEEAYVQTTTLPAGFTLKAGRFFSAIGYLNERHAHNWSFIDMPLPYRALLGVQYGDDGVQVRWLAPTPFFLEVGGELYRGDHFPAGNGDRNKPGTETAFVHAGADINDDSSWLAVASYIHADASKRDTGGDIFDGNTDLGILSGVYKWAPGGNPTQRNLTLSGEYFFGRQDGTFNAVPTRRNENGWYAQGVYQFTQRWSAGLRYARLGDVGAPLTLTGSALDGFGHAPSAVTGLLEYDSSEFGRFRVQYTRDMAERRDNDELMLQYTVVYGPHGAHRY